MNKEPLYINDQDALVTAAYEGEYELAKTLLVKGADPNVTNEHGDTAVMLASEHGFDAIVELLLDHGANVNAKDNDGDTALGNRSDPSPFHAAYDKRINWLRSEYRRSHRGV